MNVQVLAGGRYRVEGVLGHGGMASVLLARDEELGRAVAIKLIAENLAGDYAFRERFLREARTAARLAHPNVVQVFDVGEDGGRPYIVMEYVDGESLADELRRRGKLPPDEVVEIGIQVCAGLEHAHSAGVVHRDVKPGNLLRRRDGTVKIVDFGIARAAEATMLTEIGTVLGTAAYVAPEQAAGERVTAAADIYSLGVVLYELLAGKPPLTAQSLPELVAKQQEHAIKPVGERRREVPPALEAAVMHCLERDPAARPPSAAALAHELQGGSPGAATVVLPAPTGVRATDVATVPLGRRPVARRRDARRPPARSTRLWLALAGIVALAVAAIAIALGSGEGSEPGPAVRPPRVEPLPRVEDPAEQARRLAEWLRENSG